MSVTICSWLIMLLLLFLTVACQRPKYKLLQRIKYLDIAAFIPSWSFFAPNPGTTDTRILWRDKSIDGIISPWKEILPPEKSLTRMIWNPYKRHRKLLTDAGPMVLRMTHKDSNNNYILVSLPYLIILNGVMGMPIPPVTTARQFVVIQTRRNAKQAHDLQPLYASRWHNVTTRVEELPISKQMRQPVLHETLTFMILGEDK